MDEPSHVELFRQSGGDSSLDKEKFSMLALGEEIKMQIARRKEDVELKVTQGKRLLHC